MRFVFAAAWICLVGCGHVVPGSLTGDGRPFDFAAPDCEAHHDTDAAKVEVRYLGSGGLYVRWRDEALLVGPHFSNPSLLSAGLGYSRFDETRINAALDQLGPAPVRAILIGHAHYDHIGDVPAVVKHPRATGAHIYANSTGVNILRGEGLQSQATAVRAGDAFDVGAFRVRVIASGHAPQVCRGSGFPCAWGVGEVPAAWTTKWKTHRLRTFLGGETLAFDIEVRDGDEPRFRLYYNDSAAPTPLGQTTGDFDLAVLTMAQWNYVRDYPRDLLMVLRPRHVLVSHWDNFFRRDDRSFPFVPNMSNRSAAQFIRVARDYARGGAAPVNEVCGVTTGRYTMSVPRSSLLFEPREGPSLRRTSARGR